MNDRFRDVLIAALYPSRGPGGCARILGITSSGVVGRARRMRLELEPDARHALARMGGSRREERAESPEEQDFAVLMRAVATMPWRI